MYSAGHRSRYERRPPGKPALLQPDRELLSKIASAKAGLPKRTLNPYKMAHLEACEFVHEKQGMVTITAAGRRWLDQHE